MNICRRYQVSCILHNFWKTALELGCTSVHLPLPILQKIADEEWAKEAFTKIRGNVEKYADRHAADPQWIISRLAMYWKEGERYTQCYLKNQNWDRGEGDAPVPTVRMPGMRTWNKYYNVPLEDRQPYNETGDMLGLNRQNPSAPPVLVPYKESGHMIRGNNVEKLTLAENAAVSYTHLRAHET